VIVHCVLDRFSFHVFRHEAEFVPAPRDLSLSETPDLFFVETAWDSVGGGWNLGQKADQELMKELVQRYKRQGVPTVFWNKEDPPHFGQFDTLTRLFEFVLTTDADCIEKHRTNIGHDRIGLMTFAAQPRIHFCDPSFKRIPRPCFVGTNYTSRYPERKAQRDVILKPALAMGLLIYDRSTIDPVMHTTVDQYDRPAYRFPDDYDAAIVGGLRYEALCNIYRYYRVFLSVNSVQHSPTMFPRRVVELLLSGTPVLSGESRALTTLFGDCVPQSCDAKKTAELLHAFLEDDTFWSRYSIAGQQLVLGSHTATHRFADLLTFCGLPVPEEITKRKTLYELASLETTQQGISAALRREKTKEYSSHAIASMGCR
jgi:hypothetical protein